MAITDRPIFQGDSGDYHTDALSGFPADGSTDERSALNTLLTSTMPATGGRVILGLGTHLIGSSITIDRELIFPEGAKLKPASGATITFSSGIPAAMYNYQIFDLSEGGTIAFPSRHEVNALWFGMPRNGSGDAGAHIQALLDAGYRNIYFPPGTYSIETPVVRLNQVYLRGGGGDSHYEAGTRFVGTVANLGAGARMFQCCPTGGGTVQTVTFEGIAFRGGNEGGLAFNNLENATDAGIVAVDVAGVKEGAHFIQCSFTNLKRGIACIEPVDYTASVYMSHCRFLLCYRAVDLDTTTPAVATQCSFESCCDWFKGTRVVAVGCEFNNADNSPETFCSVHGSVSATAIGCWFEGGDRQVSVTGTGGTLVAIGNEMSGANNGTNFRYHFGFTEGCKLTILNNRMFLNTRIARHTPTSGFDWTGVSFFMQGNVIPTYQWSSATAENPPENAAIFIDLDHTPAFTVGGAFRATGEQSSTATGSQNNLAISPNVSVLRWTGASNLTITGMSGGLPGRRLVIRNATTNTITLKHGDTSSSEVNRFVTPGQTDFVIPASGSVEAMYDGTARRWFLHSIG